jgi:hypothetical protein
MYSTSLVNDGIRNVRHGLPGVFRLVNKVAVEFHRYLRFLFRRGVTPAKRLHQDEISETMMSDISTQLAERTTTYGVGIMNGTETTAR